MLYTPVGSSTGARGTIPYEMPLNAVKIDDPYTIPPYPIYHTISMHTQQLTDAACCMQLSAAGQVLGGAYHVGSLADAANVGPALRALSESALPEPLLPTLASSRISASHQVSCLSTHVINANEAHMLPIRVVDVTELKLLGNCAQHYNPIFSIRLA